MYLALAFSGGGSFNTDINLVWIFHGICVAQWTYVFIYYRQTQLIAGMDLDASHFLLPRLKLFVVLFLWNTEECPRLYPDE